MSRTYKKFNNRRYKDDDYDDEFVDGRQGSKGRNDWRTIRKKIAHSELSEDEEYLDARDYSIRRPRR